VSLDWIAPGDTMSWPSTTRCLSATDFSAPVDDRWFEDYTPGFVVEYGSVAVSEADIIEFAERFDPQAMHVDPELAAASRFGGLIASGWHSVIIVSRIYVDHYLSHVAAIASPGIDEVRWHAPTRPGDLLRLRATTVEARRSRSKPDRGLVRTRMEGIKGDGTLAMSLTALNLIALRDPS
jgi:acyl dehydratase